VKATDSRTNVTAKAINVRRPHKAVPTVRSSAVPPSSD
jgi:hypothetical protein